MDLQINGNRPDSRSNDKYKLKCTSIRKLIKELIFHNGALDMKLNENCKEITKLKLQREYLCAKLVEFEKFDLSALKIGEQSEDKQTKKLKKSINDVKNKTKKTKVKCNKKNGDKKSELDGDSKPGESNGEHSASDLKKSLIDKSLANKSNARNSPKSTLKNGQTKVNPKSNQPSKPKSTTSADKMKEISTPITRVTKPPDVISTSLPPSSSTTTTTSNLNPDSLRPSNLLVSHVPNCNTSSIITSSSSPATGSIGSLSIASLPFTTESSHLQISLQKGNLTGSKIPSGNGVLSNLNKIQVSSSSNSKLTGNLVEVPASKLIAESVNKATHSQSSNHHEPNISNASNSSLNSTPSDLSSCANLLSTNGLLSANGIVTINSHSFTPLNSSNASSNLLSNNISQNSISQNGILKSSDVRIIINNQPLSGQSFVIRPVNLSDKHFFTNKIVKNISVSGSESDLSGDQLQSEALKLGNKMTVLNSSPFYLNQKSDLVQDYVNLNESKAGLISLNDLDAKNNKALSFGLIV